MSNLETPTQQAPSRSTSPFSTPTTKYAISVPASWASSQTTGASACGTYTEILGLENRTEGAKAAGLRTEADRSICAKMNQEKDHKERMTNGNWGLWVKKEEKREEFLWSKRVNSAGRLENAKH